MWTRLGRQEVYLEGACRVAHGSPPERSCVARLAADRSGPPRDGAGPRRPAGREPAWPAPRADSGAGFDGPTSVLRHRKHLRRTVRAGPELVVRPVRHWRRFLLLL